MATTSKLSADGRERLRGVLNRDGVAAAYVFGSQARGNRD